MLETTIAKALPPYLTAQTADCSIFVVLSQAFSVPLQAGEP